MNNFLKINLPRDMLKEMVFLCNYIKLLIFSDLQKKSCIADLKVIRVYLAEVHFFTVVGLQYMEDSKTVFRWKEQTLQSVEMSKSANLKANANLVCFRFV